MSERKEQYCIWSHEHRAWWRPARSGYTTRLAEAGWYTFDEAAAITVPHIPPGEEVAVAGVFAARWQRLQSEEQ